jgi:hypothetical protein
MFAPLSAIVPGALVSFVALLCPVARCRTVPAEMFHSFPIAEVRVSNTSIAILRTIGLGSRGAGKEEKTAKREKGERGLADDGTELQSRNFHKKSRQERARAGFGPTLKSNTCLMERFRVRKKAGESGI